MSDSCHIPSDKEVRYAWSEVKLQEPSGFGSAVQKMELRGSRGKSPQLYLQPLYPHNSRQKGEINVSKEDKRQYCHREETEFRQKRIRSGCLRCACVCVCVRKRERERVESLKRVSGRPHILKQLLSSGSPLSAMTSATDSVCLHDELCPITAHYWSQYLFTGKECSTFAQLLAFFFF